MTGSVRSVGLAVVVSAILGGACQSQTAIVLTIDSSLVIASGRMVDQFEIVLSAGMDVYEPILAPPLAGGALGVSETINLIVADALAGVEVTISVSAFNDENFVGFGGTTVTPRLGEQVSATVTLSSCEADPALGGPFCDPVTDELVTCSAQGETVRDVCPFGCNMEQLRCNDCLPASVVCNGDVLVTCDASGNITTADTCPPVTPVCLDDRCVECTPATVECRINGDMSGTLITCDADGNTVATLECPYACDSKGDVCFDCFAGMTHCIGPDLVVCTMDGQIGTFTGCPYGCNVAAGACNSCTPGAGTVECQADDLVTCDPDGNVSATMPCTAYGCNTTIDPDACNACDPDPTITTQCIGSMEVTCSSGGQIVSSNDCAPAACNPMTGGCNSCTPGVSFCTGLGDIADCDASGLPVVVTICPYGCLEPTPGAPVCNACIPDETACQGGDLIVCDAAGGVVSTTPCAFGCDVEMGPAPDRCNECNPGTVECSGAELVTCTPDGFVASNPTCPYGCNAAPVPPTPDVCYACTPGTSECQGSSYVVCSAMGTIVTSTACGTLTNQCNTGTCTLGGCTAVPVVDGTVCSDGNFCSTGDTCTAGSCGGAARDCTDGNACTADSCDESIDLCLNNAAVLNGTVCDDGAFCTVGETCGSGLCGGAMPRNCADANVCTADSCNEAMDICVNDGPAANGTACTDGLYCTNPDVCTSGACGGPPRSCNDSNTCTADSCDETGNVCVNAPLVGMACSDGAFCTSPDACDASGVCTGPPLPCADVNPCTADSCNEVMDACVNNPTPLNGMACDDGLFCVVATTCSAGVCGAGTANCNDANTCTTDSCNEGSDTCTYAPVVNGTACEDGAFCTINDSCQSGLCATGGPRDCSDTFLCNTDSCNEAGDTCDHPCIPATSFCSTASNLVTCAGSGPSCGETNTTCTFGCNLTRNECNACNPADPNVCTGSSAIVCDTVAPGEGTITSMSTCSYACDAGGNLCFFPDTCGSPYVVPVPAPPATYGPTVFTGNLSDYGSDVAGSCGEAGDDVIHRIDVPMNGAFTAFSTIIFNTAGSAIETASHITTVCGASANELQHASVVCGASTSSGPTCYDPAGTETLRACGMPTGTYYGTLDSPVLTGAYSLALTVDNVNLDTCAESGNVSNTPFSPTITTTGLADNYTFDLTTSDSPCTPSSADSECGRPNGAPGGDTLWTCYPPTLPDGPDAVFYYRAAAAGFLTVTTLGSGYDTILFIKNACIANCAVPANCLKCNDDHNFGAGDSWSQIYRMPVTAGTLYYIFADGYGGEFGTLVLNVSYSAI